MAINVNDKSILVTGGALGIGRSICETLADAGGKVMLTDIRDTEGDAVAAGIRSAGGIAEFQHQDVTSESQWASTVQHTIDTFGGLDVLVNNAGIFDARWFADTTLEQWRKVMEVDLDSVFLGVREGVRAMRPGGAAGNGGSIVNISSTAALRGATASAPYCAAKAGVHMLTQAVAVECATLQMNIRVNSVHPAVIETPMSDEAMKVWADLFTEGDLDALKEASSGWHPLGHLGAPEDVANAVLYLASDASKFSTGTELIVDGGYCAKGI